MALLTVLLLVAVMGALTAATLEGISRSIHLAGNARDNMQARYYALGAEALAIERIEAIRELSPDKLTLQGDWANVPFTVPTADGLIALTISDGSNCFNLNSVVTGEPGRPAAIRPVGVEQFVGLQKLVGIPEAEARAVAGALVDFIDSDAVPQAAGAEDEAYGGAETPYLPPNLLVAEASELRAVRGVDAEIYGALRPYICALPTTEMSPINVNTLLPLDAPLVAMLLPNQIGLDRARQIIEDRPAQGWDDPEQFWLHPGFAGRRPASDVIDQPDVKTDYFELALTVDQGGFQADQTSLIHIGQDGAEIVARRWTREPAPDADEDEEAE